MDNTKQELKEAHDALPGSLRAYLDQNEWENKLETIAINHRLNSDQQQNLTDEVLLILLGLVHQEDLLDKLNTILSLPTEELTRIALEIQTQIFAPVQTGLDQISDGISRSTLAPFGLTDESLRARFRGLPESIQQAILATDTEQSLKNIGDKYQLHIDQLGKLNDEINFVLLGLTSASDLTKKISANLGVGLETAGNIAGEVNSQILAKIQDKIKFEGQPSATTSTPPPAPNIFEQKMAGMFSVAKNETPLPAEEKKIDPYHEPIE